MSNSNLTFSSQAIPFDNIINARELGGYEMTDGSHIRHGKLLRGGNLAKASDNDLKRLSEDFHLIHVFDFRTEGEVKYAPDRKVSGADNIWLPTIDPNTEKLGTQSLPKEAYRNLEVYLLDHCFDESAKRVAKGLYTEMVINEYTQLQYAAFLQMMANAPEGSFYWHCSQGKDRTGLGAAFLLFALGADRELVIKDFDLSNEYYKDIVEDMNRKVTEIGGTEEELKVILTFIGVNVRYFEDALDIIDKQYGGMDAYLRNQLILSEEDIATLKRRFLE